MSHLQSVQTTLQSENKGYDQLTTYLDTHNGIAWGYMHGEPRPCYTYTLLTDFMRWFSDLTELMDDGAQQQEISYAVIGSSVPGVFNLGGDLSLFHRLILEKDRTRLLQYARACIEPLYMIAAHLNRPNLKTITLVQGDALGGGFECALSGNTLIAERGSKLGFPEILFNLFPGMGALTLLGRRIGHQKAEQMILSGRLYSAEELYEMGVVDVLAEPGEGEQAVYEFVRREARARNGTLALRAAREISQPVSYDELMRITEIWVDAAFQLGPKDLRMMERLVSRQNGKAESLASQAESALLAG
ncbi:crotonase/enoyl-CoA hydratase family protein [Betaproteobacteria bacterium SCN2]|nr:crotonase/enoyl-CoA hydratase family protein [Betaproteobacteria bacterium SCN2]